MSSIKLMRIWGNCHFGVGLVEMGFARQDALVQGDFWGVVLSVGFSRVLTRDCAKAENPKYPKSRPTMNIGRARQ